MDNVRQIDFSAFTKLTNRVRKEGQHGFTPKIRETVEDLGMICRDESDGDAARKIYSVTRGDEVLELEHIDLGHGTHGYSVNRYKLVDSQVFDFGGLLAKC